LQSGLLSTIQIVLRHQVCYTVNIQKPEPQILEPFENRTNF
jgi:hypothetical protein